jgi:hypothetical protein
VLAVNLPAIGTLTQYPAMVAGGGADGKPGGAARRRPAGAWLR